MGISKIVTNTVKATVKTANAPAQATKKVASVMENAFEKAMPELQLAENSAYHSFSPETKEIVRKIRDFYWQNAKKNNTPTAFFNTDSWISNLARYGDNEKEVATLLKSTKNFNLYVDVKSKINKDLKKIIPSNDAPSIQTKLALMALFNKGSFKALAKSKGMKEIEEGRLNISYLKDIKSTDKIDEDFFYKMFDNIEKQTNKRLVNSGLDVDAVNKYLKISDKKICKDPNFINEFVSDLEKIEDPELANKILTKCDFNPVFLKYENEDFRKVISTTALQPEIVEKVLQLKQANSWSTLHISKIIADGRVWNVSDDLFNTYLKFEKANPSHCYPMTIGNINNFLSVKGVDENFAKSILANPNLTKEIGISKFEQIFSFANEKNIDILKSCLEKGKFTQKDWITFQLKGRYDLTDTEISKIYKETFEPLNNALKDTDYSYFTERMLDLRLNNPEQYQKLVDSKILDLVKEKKISPRILANTNKDFTPEVYSDVQKLLNGESLIKKFDSTKDILHKTTAGDVVSVKGKMYINNDGKLEPWNMTEEKFNELFPLVDRFSTKQGKDDCYFISVLNSLYQNPKTRGNYYKMFEQKGDDILVTIPAYKNYLGTVKFPKGEIETSWQNADAAKNVQMLERTYARTAVRTSKETPIGQNPITTDDLGYLQDRISAGHPENVFRELYPSATQNPQKVITDKAQITSALENYAQNPRYIITHGYLREGRETGHAISVKYYDPKTQTVTLTDPEEAGVQKTESLKDFLSTAWGIIVSRVG